MISKARPAAGMGAESHLAFEKEIYMMFTEDGYNLVKVFHLSGKIMGGPETQLLCNRFKEVIDSGTELMVIDFRNVRWINSLGIGTIIGCLTTLRKRGGDVRFANLRGAARHYFHVTKIDTVVEVFESVEEAVASFAGETSGL
ncbi:MAG: STAS domain-containing protein [bacterium]